MSEAGKGDRRRKTDRRYCSVEQEESNWARWMQGVLPMKKRVKKRVVKFEVYPDVGKRWRWRARSPNGKIPAVSGESFHDYTNARRAARNFAATLFFSHSVTIDRTES